MASSKELEINPNHPNRKYRILLIPFFARGHLIPMTDFACQLSTAHIDIEPTMAVTPGNATFISSTFSRSKSSGRPVQLLTYPFPSVGLKPSVETVGIGSSVESSTIDRAFYLARSGQEQLLRQYKPDAVVIDLKFPWIAAIAADLGIPCLIFLSSGTFPVLVCRCLSEMRHNMELQDQITLLGLPGPEIHMPVLELPRFMLPEEDALAQTVSDVLQTCLHAFGAVVNTFRGLESEYCQQFEVTQARQAYFVGPVSLSYTADMQDVVERGGEGDTACLRWLDSKKEGSVIFVSFGSQCYFKSAQLQELAIGLEDSGRNFLWVVRGVDQAEEWMPEGWEKRLAERGLVVRKWAPQVVILAHRAVGAFMTHCGWNSILEGTAAGVPMLTWPLAFEQFINERLVVDVIGCAARLWDGGKRSTTATESELVPRSIIAQAVSQFMEPGGEFVSVRYKARELGAMARAAMAEGGSSKSDLSRLINDLIDAIHSKHAN